jgi:hypothetical protein
MTVAEAIALLAIEAPQINKQDVKAAYRSLIFTWHPDRHSGEENVMRATEMAQQVNLAYEVLSDALEYCAFIDNVSKPQPYPAPPPKPQQYNRRQSTPRAPRARYNGSSRRRFWRDVVEHGFPDETVFEVFFESSHLVSAGYDPLSRVLYQKFLERSGSTVVYRYFDVPLDEWNKLLSAASHGSYAYCNINYSFRYERCSEPNRPYNPLWRFGAGNQARHLYQNAAHDNP